uniref:Lipocalin/cytosolic fatty-acid binding domain-containing protein n=1 Tax=Monopterus albus TaxID=43700 RepID=A0A3Q3KE82_MONAL
PTVTSYCLRKTGTCVYSSYVSPLHLGRRNKPPFMGRWFEIARLPAQFEKGHQEVILAWFPLIHMKFHCLESNRTGELRKIEGTSTVEDMQNPAKFCVSYLLCVVSCMFATHLPYSPYWSLSTDYLKSVLVYSCMDILRHFHVDFTWILGSIKYLSISSNLIYLTSVVMKCFERLLLAHPKDINAGPSAVCLLGKQVSG